MEERKSHIMEHRGTNYDKEALEDSPKNKSEDYFDCDLENF